jgi:lysine/ornithine N-monooxygenase
LNNQAAGKGDAGTSVENSIPIQSKTCNPHDSSSRPEHRDSAKKRNRGIAKIGSSSASVEVLQHIHENREKYQEKEDEQMKEILSRKDEKLCLQKEPPTKEAS